MKLLVNMLPVADLGGEHDMPGTSKAKNPKGYEVEFFEHTHKYVTVIDGHEVKYTSGTAFAKPFFKEFDPTGEITKRCAAKEGVTVEEIKAKWAAKAANSCRLGTRTHELIEDILLGRPTRHTPADEEEAQRFKHASAIARKLKDRLEIVGVELIVFDVELALAGTIDLLGKSKRDGTYVIIDHKTNADLQLDNKFNSFALPPIEHIPDTAFGHYQM